MVKHIFCSKWWSYTSLVPKPHPKRPGHTCKLACTCWVSILCNNCALHDHVVASYCWWHYSVDEQILLQSDYRQILWGKSSSLASKCSYALSFWKLRFMKSLLASFPFSNGLGTSLLLSRAKNLVIGNGRTWFLYSKWRLLTQRIQEFLQVWPGPFPAFWAGSGDELQTCW